MVKDTCTAPVKEEVKTLQRVLRRLGYFPTYAPDGSGQIKINGKFCYYTMKGLADFQSANKLTVTGTVTEETKEKLIERMTKSQEEKIEKVRKEREEYKKKKEELKKKASQKKESKAK